MDISQKTANRVIVASTVMLSFISFWRAAAIVLADLGSSAFYVPGIAENAVGKSAAWFILAVMLFSFAIRSLYIESSTMFVRGGVYRVVKEALGSTLAKVAVSALMFDFVLTGPISAVSAGQYLAGLLHDVAAHLGHNLLVSTAAVNQFSVLFAVIITVYFWWKNIMGMHESSQKALRIMQITTVMVVILIFWVVVTLLKHPAPLPPLPTHHNMVLPKESVGWLWGTRLTNITAIALLIAFGHSVLSMSGWETLAQVYREIGSPKLPNLKKAGTVVFIYSLIFTAGAAFAGEMIIPDHVRRQHLLGNLLGTLTSYLAGPSLLKLLFQGFVVLVGVIMLAGAVNTAIIGSNGVLNRVSEDGVMPDWFRKPQRKFGTTYRIVNLIVGLQLAIILASRGNVYTLGEAYAFGLIWSFTFLAVSVLTLRFKRPGPREWRIPFNLPIGNYEIPLGLGLITLVLMSVLVINLFTKEVATIYGTLFTAGFFALFLFSERAHKRRRKDGHELDQFLAQGRVDINLDTMQVRPGNVLVAVRDYNHLGHLRRVLERTDTTKQDVVVVTIRMLHKGDFTTDTNNEMTDYEQQLFTSVVATAEKAGKTVSLLIVPGSNPFDALVQTAARLRSDTIVAGLSRVLPAREQGNYTGLAWEMLPEPRPRLRLEVIGDEGVEEVFYLGPHAPRLREKDIDLLHEIWLNLVSDPRFRELHHYHVVSLALKRLKQDLDSPEREQVLSGFRLRAMHDPADDALQVPEKIGDPSHAPS